MKLIPFLVLFILTGCVVVTENPVFDDKNSVVTDTLSGKWYVYTNQEKGELMTFTPKDDFSYTVEIYDAQGTFQESQTVRFGYIDNVLCGDMYNPDKKEHAIIAVYFVKQEMHIKGLSVRAVDKDILAKKIPFHYSHMSGTVTTIKLHGTTEELHDYLKKRVHIESYWTEAILFKRQ